MLGDTLRKAREEQGLSLHDIEKGTSIRTQYIDAIERGDYSVLPGDVYARGFVRNYASFLKLDPAECLMQYKSETSNEPIPHEQHSDAVASSAKKMDSSPRRSSNRSFSSGQKYKSQMNDSPRRQNFALIGLTLVVIMVGGWIAFGSSFSTPDSVKHENPKNTKPAASVQTNQNHHTAYDPATSSDHRTSFHESNGDEISIDAHVKGRSWMQVTVDGEVVYEGIAEDGETMSWKGKQSVAISAGDAGAVSITQNGKQLGSMGGAGEVVEKTYSKNEPTKRNE